MSSHKYYKSAFVGAYFLGNVKPAYFGHIYVEENRVERLFFVCGKKIIARRELSYLNILALPLEFFRNVFAEIVEHSRLVVAYCSF